MSQPSSQGAVVIDANILLAICTKESKQTIAETALDDYAAKGWTLHAPAAILIEFMFIACQKLKSGALSQADYDKAVVYFSNYLSVILPPPNGDAALVKRAKEIQAATVAAVLLTVSTLLWLKNWRRPVQLSF